jgi:hypothetical protein
MTPEERFAHHYTHVLLEEIFYRLYWLQDKAGAGGGTMGNLALLFHDARRQAELRDLGQGEAFGRSMK